MNYVGCATNARGQVFVMFTPSDRAELAPGPLPSCGTAGRYVHRVLRRNPSGDVDPSDEAAVMRAIVGTSFRAVAKSAGSLERVGAVGTLASLLAGIDQALPRPAVMFIEGTSIASEPRVFLDRRSIEPEPDDLWGTVWPRSEGFDVPLTDENLRDLAELASRHPEHEICDHITVYRGDRVILVAHDVGSEVLLDRELPDTVIELFQQVAGARSE